MEDQSFGMFRRFVNNILIEVLLAEGPYWYQIDLWEVWETNILFAEFATASQIAPLETLLEEWKVHLWEMAKW